MKKFTLDKASLHTQKRDLSKIAKSNAQLQIQIDPELKAFIPPLKPDELSQLEQNILEEGVRDPLIIWDTSEGSSYLIDGHNRYGIIQKHKLDFKVERKNFPDKEAVKDWMINLQLGRRNLTKEQSGYLRGLQYNREKKKASDTLLKGANAPFPQNEGAGETAQILASQHKVSRATIERDALFAKGLESIGSQYPDKKTSILSGELKIKKSDIQAIGQGKKSVDDIVGTQNLETNQQSNTVQTQFIASSDSQYTEAQIKKIDVAKSKLDMAITQLLKAGLDKKTIRSIFSEELKNK
ncbi:ParB N-terminal domain-containing protein [Aureibacter tunicatorum]|uniref:ParB/Sulfiredoxin domain-containing protein n=1 Tax=Aureibacter tunicatorum TaxID=866807 RepID=A0AAE3XU11_9BACT|nr:ParB N-terminal domain-containing protein [Aureibacter tunicatorum]MDR6241949.1 hypothetical protein [Aureibacter tunicatorum]BDD07502.1 hypothetical protein AUTU_49850 [Aureibacter tunicatorum]